MKSYNLDKTIIIIVIKNAKTAIINIKKVKIIVKKVKNKLIKNY